MQSLFGTDGIRGRVGTGLFVAERLIAFGNALGHWIITKHPALEPRILIAHDTRASAPFIKSALKAGLLRYPLRVFDAGVLPTPAVAHLMQGNFDYAIIISASHNPASDNGIKIMTARGKLSAEDELLVSSLVNNGTGVQGYEQFGSDEPFNSAQDQYCAKILQHFAPQLLAGVRVVLDMAQGATYLVASRIFTALGATVIARNDQPTGYNINAQCGSVYPAELQRAVVETSADIGFAFDGDGDRVIAVNREGVLKDGDDLLALLLQHPAYQASPAVVGTIMTNEGFADWLTEQNKQLIRTPVGDKYVAEQLNTQVLLLGGESSGHIILNDILGTGDGILAALRVLETVIRTNNWSLTTFDKYPQALINMPVTMRHDLETSPVQTIIRSAQQRLARGRILVRYSGTENVLRLMVETDNPSKAQLSCEQLAQDLGQLLQGNF